MLAGLRRVPELVGSAQHRSLIEGLRGLRGGNEGLVAAAIVEGVLGADPLERECLT